jgi:hypothetical protein
MEYSRDIFKIIKFSKLSCEGTVADAVTQGVCDWHSRRVWSTLLDKYWQENPNYSAENFNSCTFPVTNPTPTELGVNRERHMYEADN